MVKTIKPTITVIDNIEWQLLVLGIVLLIFVTVLLYFSRYYYNKNYKVSQVYDAQTGQDKPTVTPGNLKPCGKKGYCVVDLESGLKNCPSNPNTLMYYDSTSQTCSAKTLCPSLLPYAVNGDGSVNKYGTCENDTACRCTGDVTCAKYVVSKFSVTNGNIYSSYASEKNFILEQVPYSQTDSVNGSIKIDTNSEFCKINSTYSGSLVGGCSFLNQTNDFLMKCEDESTSASSVSPYSLDPYYYDSGDTITKQYCEVQPYLDSNWNNMTLCVNQNPCKYGNYTYNFDVYRQINGTVNSDLKGQQVNSRNFCQYYASNLDTYLSDLQYYTLSCINGIRCNQLPNIIDEVKFYAGENNELDISAINASYNAVYTNNTLNAVIETEDVTTGANYNPLQNKIRSGDLVYNETQKRWYTIRVNPWANTVEFYEFTFYPYIIWIYNNVTNVSQSDKLTYYPQFALNGFGYNTVVSNSISLINRDFIENGTSTFYLTNSYRIGNVKNSTVPNDPGGGYNPSFNIMSNQTLYRAGLSKPRGYVYKEFEQEVATQEAITDVGNQTAFNADNYKIKQTPFDTKYYNDISLYNPVWNNQYGRTECIRCSPLLVASINMAQISSQGETDGFVYDAVTIQFSGQDFGHYRMNFQQLSNPQKLWCFESRAFLNKTQTSTTSKIYLERPNVNIKKGDYILSSTGEFNFKIKPLIPLPAKYIFKAFLIFMGDVYQATDSPRNFTPFYDSGTDPSDINKAFFGLGVDNNIYQDFVKDEHMVSLYNGEEFVLQNTIKSTIINKFLGTNDKGGAFFGNKFTAIYTEQPTLQNLSPDLQAIADYDVYATRDYTVDATIVPSVTVKDISDNFDVITTEGYDNTKPFTETNLNSQAELQFISKDRNLYLNNDMSDVNKGLSGNGGVIQIDSITDGRISSIKVVESGSGYTNISPRVAIASYDRYLK